MEKKKTRVSIELNDRTRPEPINLYYFGLQILVSILVVVIESLVAYSFLGITEVPFTVSAWLLGLSIAYLFYKDNEYVYSAVLAGFMAIIFVISLNLASGNFLDLQHIPTFFIAIHIITQKREFEFSVVFFGTIIIILWIWTVYLTGLAYQYFPLYFLFALTFISACNLLFFYGFTKKQTTADKPIDPRTFSLDRGQGLFLSLLAIVLVFLIGGNILAYWQGWLYGITSLLTILFASRFFLKHSLSAREFMLESDAFPPRMKWWDKALYVIYIPLHYLIIIIAGLDVIRFQWTPGFHPAISIISCIGLGFSTILKYWALATNESRSGPYRCIRHPGYLSKIIGSVSIPLVLGSIWAFIPAGIIIILLILRTYKDDKNFAEESPEYVAYTKKVKYLLLPKIF